MPDTSTTPHHEGQTEKILVYLSPSLLKELDSRVAAATGDEGYSRSRIVRDALRSHFRKKPRGVS